MPPFIYILFRWFCNLRRGVSGGHVYCAERTAHGQNGEVYFLSPFLVLLSVAKLYAAGRWLGFTFPPGMAFYCIAWLVFLTLPANVIRVLASQDEKQHLVAWGFFWAVALFVGSHLGLAHWQRDRRWPRTESPFANWWVGWIILLILALIAVIQLYTTMWGMYI